MLLQPTLVVTFVRGEGMSGWKSSHTRASYGCNLNTHADWVLNTRYRDSDFGTAVVSLLRLRVQLYGCQLQSEMSRFSDSGQHWRNNGSSSCVGRTLWVLVDRVQPAGLRDPT